MTRPGVRRLGAPWLRAVLLFAAGAALAGALWSTTGRDDVHITYGQAQALAESGALRNYNGEAVEQSSSLLEVLLLALLAAPGLVSLPTLGLLLSLAFWLASTLLVEREARDAGSRNPADPAILVATSPFLAYWAWSGMEVSLYAFLLLAAALWGGRVLSSGPWRPRRWLEGLGLFAGLALVRPEGMFVLATALGLCALAWATRALRHRPEAEGPERPAAAASLLRAALLLAGVALAVVGGRLALFGLPFPSPVSGKADGLDPSDVARGAAYLRQFVLARPGALLLAAGAAWGALRIARRFLARDTPGGPERAVAVGVAAAALLAANGAFVVASGGDWMEAGRFVAPGVPVAALLFGRALGSTSLSERLRRAVVLAVLAANLAGMYVVAAGSGAAGPAEVGSTGRPAWTWSRVPAVARREHPFAEWSNRVKLREIPVARALASAVGALGSELERPVRVLTRQMGLVASHTALRNPGAVHFLDRHGLATRHFLECPLTASARRSRWGLEVPLEPLLAGWVRLRRECDIAPPDLVYDLRAPGPSLRRRLRWHGYRLVFARSGALLSGSRWAPGARVATDQFIAVRRELRGHLPEPLVDPRLLAAGGSGRDDRPGASAAPAKAGTRGGDP